MTSKTREIYCCACSAHVEARLTDGKEIYPHRPDLSSLPFWKCDACGNFVGCHHKTKARITPLGCIPTPQIKQARKAIHSILDPLWKSRRFKRGHLYAQLSEVIGRSYHTGQIRSLKEAGFVLNAIKAIAKGEAA